MVPYEDDLRCRLLWPLWLPMTVWKTGAVGYGGTLTILCSTWPWNEPN